MSGRNTPITTETLIADARAFALGMEEERRQILAILKHRRSELYQFGYRRNSGEWLEVNNLIKLLEERSRMGS